MAPQANKSTQRRNVAICGYQSLSKCDRRSLQHSYRNTKSGVKNFGVITGGCECDGDACGGVTWRGISRRLSKRALRSSREFSTKLAASRSRACLRRHFAEYEIGSVGATNCNLIWRRGPFTACCAIGACQHFMTSGYALLAMRKRARMLPVLERVFHIQFAYQNKSDDGQRRCQQQPEESCGHSHQ